MTAKRRSFMILCLLGSLSVISPFAIDLYLPAFSRMAAEMNTTSAVISLTLSSYFIGLAVGQVAYGPLLDRFGRKRPLLAGLCLFILASLSCMAARNVEELIALRFLQALGGGVAGVASLAMVRDFFPVEESAKIFSLLFLFIGVSPLLAPTIGGMVVVAFGWKMVFVMLAVVVALILACSMTFLPEGHVPDKGISLRPDRVLREYWQIVKQPQFFTYAIAGAFSFAGLFTFVAGAPIIFMEEFGQSAEHFGIIFACLAGGFIAGNQINILLLRRFTSRQIFQYGLMVQTFTGLVFLLGAFQHWYGLIGTLVLFFAFLFNVGITNPNAAALALMPFSRNAGSASAMLGFIQMGVGALISTGIGLSDSKGALPIILILACTTLTGAMILFIGRRFPQPILFEEVQPTSA